MRTLFHISSQPGRRRGARRGASVLEFVLVIPILIMLGFGIVDYGYFFYVKNTVQGAAQSGARAAISSIALQSDVTTTVGNIMNAAGLQNSGYTVTTSPSDITTASAGTTVSVTVKVNWSNVGLHTLSSGYGGISNSKVITGAASMRKESN